MGTSDGRLKGIIGFDREYTGSCKWRAAQKSELAPSDVEHERREMIIYQRFARKLLA